MQCTSTGRKCTYTSIFRHQPLPINPINQPVNPSPNPTSRERRCFEYYFHHAAPSLSGSLDHPFWSVYVLQLCRTEPAIWDGLISLSALFERPPITDQSSPTALLNAPTSVKYEYHRDALTWYSRSLAGINQRINRGGDGADLSVVLVGTIIYIAIEFLQGNYRAVLGLYRQGVKLMAGNFGTESGLKSAVRAMFRRLRTQVLIFSGLPNDDEELDQPALSEIFESIDQARNALFELISEMKQLLLAIKSYRAQTGSASIPSSHALTTQQAELKQRLHRWHHAFTSSPCSKIPQTEHPSILVLLMNHTAILLETQTCLSASESAYDSQRESFKKILEYADNLTSSPSPSATTTETNTAPKRQPFSFELSTFLPLFITALKCRYPDLRRKALRLLSGGDTSTTVGAGDNAAGGVTGVQGLFLSRPAAQLVAIIVGLEEGSYLPPPPPPPPPFPLSEPLQNQPVYAQGQALRRSVVDTILPAKGTLPEEKDRICDFWISSSDSTPDASSSPATQLPFPSAQEKRQHQQQEDTNPGHRSGNGIDTCKSWLYYRRYTSLPLPPQDGRDEEHGERKMGYVYVTRRVRLPHGL
ncbi:hypothetical protein DPV78_012551 [Talaromyces pinophilus]|nr:hypothetical protein DPV78_012551 [Talaromyces pinophilus]